MTTATANANIDAAPGYVSTAFYSQYNLILLGGSALFSLASASALPLAAGVAAELLWLAVGPRLPAFRRRVEQQADTERRARLDDDVMQGMRGMGQEHAARLRALGQNISWITLRAESALTAPAERAALLELEQLRLAFLRLCRVDERLTQRLEEMRLAPPEQEVQELSQAYAAEKDLGLRFTIHQSIKLAQRKVEQQSRLVDVQRQIELKRSLIEQSVAHLQSQQQLGESPDLLRDIQGVVGHAAAVSALEAELAQA
jgi:hypothetical protein